MAIVSRNGIVKDLDNAQAQSLFCVLLEPIGGRSGVEKRNAELSLTRALDRARARSNFEQR
jgi:hypothetical protein